MGKSVLNVFYKLLPGYDWRMSRRERALFRKTAKCCKNYLEFGSGGSTICILKNTHVEKLISVESSQEWIDHMKRDYKVIRRALENKRLVFHYVDIGKTGAWGRPIDEDKKSNYPNYSHEVFEKYRGDYDMVLIDGRFRVACALQTIMNTSDNVKILIHDFTNRPEYHCLLNYLTPVKTADTLVVFSKKQGISKSDLERDYKQYRFISE